SKALLLSRKDLPAPLDTETIRMGRTLIAGNFNGDSAADTECVDLAVTAEYGPIFRPTGLVSVFHGDPLGLNKGPAQARHFWTGNASDLPDVSGSIYPDRDFSFGHYLSIADFNN